MNENKITHPVVINPVKFVLNSKSNFVIVSEEYYKNLENFANKQASYAGSILNQFKNLK